MDRLTFLVDRDLVRVLDRPAMAYVFQLGHDVLAALDEVPDVEEGGVRFGWRPGFVALDGSDEGVELGDDGLLGLGVRNGDHGCRCWCLGGDLVVLFLWRWAILAMLVWGSWLWIESWGGFRGFSNGKSSARHYYHRCLGAFK